MTEATTDKRELTEPEKSGLIVLTLLSLVAGAAVGLIGVLFNRGLEQAESWRTEFLIWAREYGVAGLGLAMLACSVGPALAAWLVRRFAPHAGGSGIPHVEAVIQVRLPPTHIWLLPVKFIGGILAIGSGLALGREGPTVQMGASLSHFISNLARRAWPDGRVLLAAGSGAGLATAFNAPISGAVFVLEELVRRFETRMAVGALAASAAAMAVVRAFLGHAPQFMVGPLPYPQLGSAALFFLLGCLAGALAAVYNAALLRTLDLVESFRRCPVEARAALIGAAVGLVGWCGPGLVGGGGAITQEMLDESGPIGLVLLVLAIRFVLALVSYAAATPGGLFAPMLVLGAQIGFLYGSVCHMLLPGLETPVAAFVVVGMTAFFTGVVRSPLTGIALILEMTGSSNVVVPMLAACCAAMAVPMLLGSTPIYESLLSRILPAQARQVSEK